MIDLRERRSGNAEYKSQVEFKAESNHHLGLELSWREDIVVFVAVEKVGAESCLKKHLKMPMARVLLAMCGDTDSGIRLVLKLRSIMMWPYVVPQRYNTCAAS